MNLIAKLLLLSICILAVACKKDSADAEKLQGRWELTESYQSTGGPGSWYPAAKKAQIVFEDDGKLSGDAYSKYVKYAIKDSVTLSFFDDKDAIQYYRYSIEGKSLYLSPAGPIRCVEGCSSRYLKMND
ncbi:lipocalin family protein [Mucilaginibacter sp. Bleaf8]|uniref:lipocalin family protein n=1 Tax=Mucilaginibacter sp. Bleaf8 TaxID=2834430 RepID=UPI001BCADAD5|nr:lipocalin family protein [Mucilaginibacter sp. Bleaf8]MBS7566160.1 lipocalin family protein [Mucilaginibacter sp. Bleaf8]